MLFAKYLLLFTGIGLLLGAAGILIHDLYVIFKSRREQETSAREDTSPFPAATVTLEFLRRRTAGRLAAAALAPLLLGLGITVIPSGEAAVRISQVSGTLPGTLYPGVHWIVPLMEHVETFSIRDHVFTTTAGEDPKRKGESLRVQSKEGLTIGLAVAVRYRLDPSKLAHIQMDLPRPVEAELVPPVVASVFREITPNYMVREIFATRREEVRKAAATAIVNKLGADGLVVKEVMLRDVQLPTEYAKGMEGLLLKEQENERMSVELELKQKMVRSAELEAAAQKAREVKAAEAQAQVTVLQAKAQADAMQHTLPLKEKQIQQSRLEAEARKEATVKNAEAMAQAKVIDSRAELDRRKLMSEAEEYNIRRVAEANSERMKLEAEVLKQNPLLIQKIIAERLSDKVQIMMVPNDGKFFFANDVLKGLHPAAVQ
jgi:regulator of protease activity HflC (stomatin/prohibitin superfamily)